MQKGAEEGKRKLKKEAENEKKKKWKIRKKRYWNHAHVPFFIRFLLKNNTYFKVSKVKILRFLPY